MPIVSHHLNGEWNTDDWEQRDYYEAKQVHFHKFLTLKDFIAQKNLFEAFDSEHWEDKDASDENCAEGPKGSDSNERFAYRD